MRARWPVAVLHQAAEPPVVGGQRKAMKPGGYSDSGADIAYTLQQQGWSVVTPSPRPDPEVAMDWVFPDTREGLAAAAAGGAQVLWANTVLFEGHPLEARASKAWIVGQPTRAAQAADDKFATNRRLAMAGLPVARSFLADERLLERPGDFEDCLSAISLSGSDWVVKPVRGRGSQGVVLAHGVDGVRSAVADLLASGRFGDRAMVERYLPGDELTIAVMPPGQPGEAHAALPPVRRINHVEGVAPYNGDVAVVRNSEALAPREWTREPILELMAACARAAAVVGARAPVRIDCRLDPEGRYRLFDLNMKPNMTGAGRPGRDDQDSLVALAARARGWTYGDLLEIMAWSAWKDARDGFVTLLAREQAFSHATD